MSIEGRPQAEPQGYDIPPIRAVLFDADGVLITPPELFSLGVARTHGLDQAKIQEFFFGPFVDCLCGTLDLKQALAAQIETWGWTLGVQAYIDLWFGTENVVEQRLLDTIAVLRSRHIRCFLATNQEPYRLEYILKEMRFESMFDGIICSCRLGVRKPDIEYFRRAWQDMAGLQPSEALFWDDRQQNVDVARSFGMHAELYTDFDDFTSRMARYLPQ